MTCALPGGGARRSQEGLYVIDKRNGASTLAIQGGHAIDALRYCVGDPMTLSAVVANQYETVEIIETGAHMPKDAPDQILVAGLLGNGAVVSIAINGGVVAGHGIELAIFGEEGSLVVGWPGWLNFQMSELRLHGARLPDRALAPLDIPSGYDPGVVPADFRGRQPYPGVDVPRATIVNVAGLYAGLARAVVSDEKVLPDFATGLSLHHLLDRIEAASDSGIAQS
jgi:predicted dehydrogenase